jgi:hypothetical protein
VANEEHSQQDGEDLVQSLRIHNVTNSNEIDVVRADPHCQITLGDPENQVLAVLSLDLAHLHRFDEGCAVENASLASQMGLIVSVFTRNSASTPLREWHSPADLP